MKSPISPHSEDARAALERARIYREIFEGPRDVMSFLDALSSYANEEAELMGETTHENVLWNLANNAIPELKRLLPAGTSVLLNRDQMRGISQYLTEMAKKEKGGAGVEKEQAGLFQIAQYIQNCIIIEQNRQLLAQRKEGIEATQTDARKRVEGQVGNTL